jgi:hypothetical protein
MTRNRRKTVKKSLQIRTAVLLLHARARESKYACDSRTVLSMTHTVSPATRDVGNDVMHARAGQSTLAELYTSADKSSRDLFLIKKKSFP